MEIVHIDVLKNRSYTEKEKIKAAVLRGISTALKKSKNVAIKVHEKSSEELLRYGKGSEKFTLVVIPHGLGNSNKRRRNLFNEVANELKKTGLSNDDIYIIINMQMPKSWKKIIKKK